MDSWNFFIALHQSPPHRDNHRLLPLCFLDPSDRLLPLPQLIFQLPLLGRLQVELPPIQLQSQLRPLLVRLAPLQQRVLPRQQQQLVELLRDDALLPPKRGDEFLLLRQLLVQQSVRVRGERELEKQVGQLARYQHVG